MIEHKNFYRKNVQKEPLKVKGIFNNKLKVNIIGHKFPNFYLRKRRV